MEQLRRCSLRCSILGSLGQLTDDAWVAGVGRGRLGEGVGVRGHELPLVV